MEKFNGVGSALKPATRVVFHRPRDGFKGDLLARKKIEALFALRAFGGAVNHHHITRVVDVQDHGARRIHQEGHIGAVVGQTGLENERMGGVVPWMVGRVDHARCKDHVALIGRDHADEQRGHQQPRQHQQSACRLLAHVKTWPVLL